MDGYYELGGLFFGGELGNLRDPIREPTADVNGHHGQHQIRYLAMGFLLLFRLVLRPYRFQFLYDQTIKHQNQAERYEKTADESVQRKRRRLMKLHLKRRHVITNVYTPVVLIPIDRARIIPILRPVLNLSGMRNQRNHQHNAERPRQNGNDSRNGRRPPFRRRNRMTNRYIPISAHNKQKNRTGKLVNTRQNQIRLAHDRPKNPRLFDHRHDQKWNPDQEAFVRNREIYNVHVGDGLHF